MGYHLGVDLGTTFTAAAAMNGGAPTMVGLGNRSLQIPSVLYFHPDGTVLVGEAAELRSSSDPTHAVREFKRRIGDPVPILVGGRPFSAQALSGRLLRWVVDKATEQLGAPPSDITLTYPANWAHFKIDLLRQVAVLADVNAVRACSEPEAAALQYASKTTVNPGDRIAVYDLGGGTFDVCVLEKTAIGFRILGRPEGIEHLGGIDFDEAVFRRVIGQLPPDAFESGSDDDAQLATLGRLRRDCVEAKEVLSTDVEAVIPVALPASRTSVRLTRGEFEDIIRPALEETIGATRRALRSAETDPARLTAMVLVGGSSRIPLVAELLGNEFRCPIAVDTHPKNDVAMGAARAATLQDGTAELVAPSRRIGPFLAADVTPGVLRAAAVTNPESWTGSAAYPGAYPGAMPTGQPSGAAATGYQAGGPRHGGPGQAGGLDPTTGPHDTGSTVWPQGRPGTRSGLGTGGGPGPSGGPVNRAEPPVGPGVGGPRPAADPARRRRIRIAIVAGAIAVLLAGTAAVVLTRSGGDNTPAAPLGSTPATAGSAGSTPAGSSAAVSGPPATAGSSPAPSAPTSAASTVPPSGPRSATVSPVGLPASTPLPDNQLVVARQVDKNVDLYLVDAAAGGVLNRLTTAASESRSPVLSPDRGTIAYTEQTDTTRVLRVMAADGAGDRPLFATPPNGCARMNRPGWNPVSPGELALVCLDAAGKYSLQIVGVDGQVVRVLDTGLQRIDDPSYSPDGTRLTFWASDPSTFDGGSIFVMPADGSAPPTALTTEPVGTDADPVWSPDGTQIAFRRRLPNNTPRGNFDVFLIGADGQGLRPLTTDPVNDSDPSFSPDGSRIVFISERSDSGAAGPGRLWIMNADGSDPRLLLPDDAATEDATPGWSRR